MAGIPTGPRGDWGKLPSLAKWRQLHVEHVEKEANRIIEHLEMANDSPARRRMKWRLAEDMEIALDNVAQRRKGVG
ncbi:hypothetical protein SLEP1_g37963 [Rubroshorea leprosula]|uniref:Uncharacterized protein n=1 Tax=Rubroshorea leprosula TaxID=152421 RepID=A0AAV5KWK8_9ROSI|nr:hypothetical protein SLEP1_g37963 [Rubroshorea leprosula]